MFFIGAFYQAVPPRDRCFIAIRPLCIDVPHPLLLQFVTKRHARGRWKLPAIQAHGQGNNEAGNQPIMQSTPSTLLVVDDHPMALSGTTAFLAEMLPDVSVHAAAGTHEALSIINRGIKPEIVLLDIWLRDGTGFDALPSLRALLPDARFMFMSAEATPDIVAKAKALGAAGFVGKHLDGAAFARAIREVR
ncbi:MAG TPA: response regulator, partial [Pseudoxanthomonas sp.]|nr:response regulator [Pseudoxanthomonas sp.]